MLIHFATYILINLVYCAENGLIMQIHSYSGLQNSCHTQSSSIGGEPVNSLVFCGFVVCSLDHLLMNHEYVTATLKEFLPSTAYVELYHL